MADEIEEFLRRAAMRRAAQQAAQQQAIAQQQAAQQAPQQQPYQQQPYQEQAYQPPPPARKQPPSRPVLSPTYTQDQPVAVEVVYDDPQKFGAGVSSHVAQAMDNRQFSERASHLGERVGQADDDMDAHLHQKFDHQLGQLKSTTEKTPVQPSFDESRRGDAGAAPAGAGDAANLAAGVMAADIAQLFRTPRNIRNAIILSEILSRPEHRW